MLAEGRRIRCSGDDPQVKVREIRRQWRTRNLDKKREHERQRHLRNPEHVRILQRERRARNSERVQALARTARKRRFAANPDVFRAASHRERARKYGLHEHFTTAEWRALRTWFGNVCVACDSPDNVEVDHVVPLSTGGTNDIANIQPLCESCNSRKKAQAIDYRHPDRLAAFLATLAKEG